MSTALKLQIQSTDSEITEVLGANMGAQLKGGEVIELASDLGGGKTTFTRGLVRGAGSTDHVSSPTFTVSKFYSTDNLQIHHFDLYRLDEVGHMAHEISELQQDPTNVLVLEWAGVADAALPAERLVITFEATSELGRLLTFEYPKSLEYLVKGLA